MQAGRPLTRQLGGLVDVVKLVRALRAEQLLHEPADLRPPPLALPALETSLVLDALEGRVTLEVFDLVHAEDFTVHGYGAVWSFLLGALEHDVLPTPEDLAAGLAAHFGADEQAVIDLVRRVAASPVVVVPSVRDRAERVRDVAHLRRLFAAVQALDLEARAHAHARGELDTKGLLARLRAAWETP